MKWTFDDFHPALKDLAPEVRDKAIAIAASLIAEKKCTRDEAIEEAIKRAEEWFLNKSG